MNSDTWTGARLRSRELDPHFLNFSMENNRATANSWLSGGIQQEFNRRFSRSQTRTTPHTFTFSSYGCKDASFVPAIPKHSLSPVIWNHSPKCHGRYGFHQHRSLGGSASPFSATKGTDVLCAILVLHLTFCLRLHTSLEECKAPCRSSKINVET